LIDTEGQMAIDAFYLTSQGKKLTSEHQKKIEKALVDELKSLESGG
jgi:UTP:GlnB (protein PII) uridylyltransferase